MRTISLAAAFAAFVLTSGCEKTGEGEYEVQKPVIGSETDKWTKVIKQAGITLD